MVFGGFGVQSSDGSEPTSDGVQRWRPRLRRQQWQQLGRSTVYGVDSVCYGRRVLWRGGE